MLQRFYEEGLAQASYLVGCERSRQACVIDPRRDVDVYVEVARRLGLTLAWNGGHIEGATHVPVGDVPGRASELAGSAPIATLCEGGFRSSLAASLLARAGIDNLINATGGLGAVREMRKGMG